MQKLLLPLTGVFVAIALVAAACGGGDDGDEEAQAQAQADSQQAAEEEQAVADPEPREQAQSEQPAEEVQRAAEEEQAAAEEEAQAEEQAEEEQDADKQSDLPPDQLAYGGTIRASVLTPEESSQFRFEGTEGDLVRIRVDGLDGMDPIVTLLEPNRTEVLSNDDVSVANRDSLLIATLPSTGLQVVRITPFDATSGGEFVLSVELLDPEVVDDSAIISIGDVVDARLHTPGDVDTFEFAGDAGQIVRIRAAGEIGVDTYMEVFGPDGTFLALNDDSGHGLDAEVELELSQSGSYRIDIFASAVGIRPPGDGTRDRHKIGDYQFSVVVLPAPVEASGQTATALASLALTYLDAVQQSDALTIFGLSGPEQIDQTGWQSAEDVSRDLSRQQDIVTAGTAGDVTAEVEGDRARVRVTIAVPGTGSEETLRFDAVNVNGQWLVDFVERFAERLPDDDSATDDAA